MAPYLAHDGGLRSWLEVPVLERDIETAAIAAGESAAAAWEGRGLRRRRRRCRGKRRCLSFEDAAKHAEGPTGLTMRQSFEVTSVIDAGNVGIIEIRI